MQAKALTLFSNLRARKVAAAKRHSSSTTSNRATTNVGSSTLQLFKFPSNGTTTTSVKKTRLTPQPFSDEPISPLTLQQCFSPAAGPKSASVTRASSTITQARKSNEPPVLDVSLLKETRNIRLGKGTAITPRRGRKAQKIYQDDGEDSLAYQLRCYSFDVAGSEARMARVMDSWEGMISPKTMHVPAFALFVPQQIGQSLNEDGGSEHFDFAGGIEDVPALIPDVDETGLETDVDGEVEEETKSEGSRKRSWDEYDADDETEDDFDVETWLDGKMESGDEEVLSEMAKKAVETMGREL